MLVYKMAMNGNDNMNLTLVFGQKKIPIHLDLTTVEPPANCLTVGHLSDAVFKETAVEPSCQKLIFKGKSLTNPEQSLSSTGMRNGARIMLLGRKLSERKEMAPSTELQMEANLANKLEDLQRKVEALCARYDAQTEDASAIRDLTGLKSTKKSFLQFHEDSMKLLEKIDSTPTQDNDQFRRERKVLVNTLQNKLDLCEKKIDEISQQIQALEKNTDDSGS